MDKRSLQPGGVKMYELIKKWTEDNNSQKNVFRNRNLESDRPSHCWIVELSSIFHWKKHVFPVIILKKIGVKFST